MWYYVKTLQHPINLKSKDLKMAGLLITQYGGPDGELSASLRYLNQRFTMPTGETKGLLNDIGTDDYITELQKITIAVPKNIKENVKNIK